MEGNSQPGFSLFFKIYGPDPVDGTFDYLNLPVFVWIFFFLLSGVGSVTVT